MRIPSSTIKLLLPGLFGPMPNLVSGGVDVSVPGIERVLARADREAVPGRDYLETLYALFGCAAAADVDLPQGAVGYMAEGGAAEARCFLRADPVHLRPDRDRLLLFDCSNLAIQAQEAEAIAAEFNRHFAGDGMRLLVPHPERWYLQLERCPALCTSSLSEVVGHHIETFMPRGEEAPLWRQRLNEMQMLLFQSPVNRQREDSGRLTINGIWLSGGGRLPTVSPRERFSVFADEPNARGLARLAGLPRQRSPGTESLVWSAPETRVVVCMDLLGPVVHVDAQAWAEALQAVESRMQALLGGMRTHPSARLELYPCHGEVFTLTPSKLRRFWRRGRKLSEYLN